MAVRELLVGYWDLDEASGNAIDAHAAFDLTDHNTVGAAEGGRDFESGNSEWFEIADNASISMNGDVDWAIWGWFKFESRSTYQGIFSKWNQAGSSQEYTLYFEQAQNKFAFAVSSDGTSTTASVLSDITLSDGSLYFFLAWVDTTANTINLQVNGGTIQSAAFSVGVFSGTADLRFGSMQLTGNDTPADGIGKSFGMMKGGFPSSGFRSYLLNAGTPLKYAQVFPNITTTTLPDGVEEAPYSQQLNATGGAGSLEWSLLSGSLPSGFTLSGGGLVSGTAGEGTAGAYPITVETEDDNGEVDTQALTLTILEPVQTVWSEMPLVPRTNMIAWHHWDATYSADGAVYDFSGNQKHLAGSSPTLTQDVLNGQPAWYFDGADTPLVHADSITVKHGFILVSMDDANFSVQRGLLTGETSGVALAGDNGTTEFIEQTFDTFYKSAVSYSTNNRQSPVSGKFALIEFTKAAGIALDGIQIGQYLGNTSQRWKGYFVEQILYSGVLTQLEREAIYLYFAIRYKLFNNGTESIDLYFPSDDIVGFRRHRFFEAPPDFEAITDSFEFADGGRSFNEVGDDAPQKWEYMWTGLTPEQQSIFREFYKAARKVQPFFFRAPDETVYEDVRCETFEAPHSAHKSWDRGASFGLIKYP